MNWQIKKISSLGTVNMTHPPHWKHWKQSVTKWLPDWLISLPKYDNHFPLLLPLCKECQFLFINKTPNLGVMNMISCCQKGHHHNRRNEKKYTVSLGTRVREDSCNGFFLFWRVLSSFSVVWLALCVSRFTPPSVKTFPWFPSWSLSFPPQSVCPINFVVIIYKKPNNTNRWPFLIFF